MSVINQMLKDLDGRQAEQSPTGVRSGGVQPKSSNKNRLTLIFLALILLVLLVIAWQLMTQKVEANRATTNSESALVSKINQESNSTSGTTTEPKVSETVQNAVAPKTTKPKDIRGAKTDLEQIEQNTPVSSESTEQTNVANANNKTVDTTVVTPAQTVTVPVKEDQQVAVKSAPTEDKVISKVEPQQEESSLSISHKKLTPEELVAQKMRRVEVNINEGNTSRAEALLEEVLLVDASHNIARKQLAALWFGRQDYSAAHNLLTQGIALMPEYAEFRLMKARIYLKENNVSQAVNSLLPLSHTESVDYQSVLAAAAQQNKQHDIAADAFKKLTTLEPTKGKWWLGYGASLDSQGEFQQAKQSYRQALATSSLSDNAQQFIRQRLTALGE
ncbi:tetratricopeptide repeat protein [Thalassotalea marina]|uniref:MSHA biogenesis protein MshN n=1 Tax=Thalassotalea marina TaxID=1673741 RepID=A0A919BE58_9GAMM|nr:tetratricopeptide repeat protein [Thalassotalea marina]GHF82787.1 MSHA biogenesis protein MshN [Thalassotalea marina]